MATLHKTIKIIFWLSCVLLVVSRLHIYKLPDQSLIDPRLLSEPVQKAASLPHFVLADPRLPIRYDIQPRFDYDLYGLVVAYHHSKDDLSLTSHTLSDDYLNSVDVCVVWGSNIRSGAYQKVKYSHGDWTCYWQSKWGDRTEWRAFDNDALSNNHLLPANLEAEELLLKLRPGDQIHLAGQLVNYKATSRDRYRNTSTTRKDQGNGACEVMYVSAAELLSVGHPTWRWLYGLSKVMFLLSAAFLIFHFLRLQDLFLPSRKP